MKRVLLSASILIAVGAFVFFSTGASSPSGGSATYKIELDNAFGLVTGADFKVAGVPAGSIQAINLDQKTLDAVVTVNVSTPGLSTFHTSATCDSEPQSLIGEYFISCDPGTTGPVIPPGSTIPVSHTQSTIPADLILDVLQVPEQERLPLIIGSLGAGVAGNSGNLEQTLDRAVPALTETDDLLNLLADDSGTLKSLTSSSDAVITALADNTGAVDRFITYANNAAQDTAAQKQNFQDTLQELPGFLAQLKPAMARLGEATDANLPVLEHLNAASGQLDTLFTTLPGFSRASLPALRALGKAGVVGKVALTAARPVIAQLNQFATHTPELAKNLSIVLPEIDTQKTATEPNSRSPGGKGYSGLEALLQFVFNLAGATNYYGPYGHLLAVDGFVSAMCTPYATPATVAANLAQYGAAYRSCYSFLGPNQPGVNETDPSDPSACVPDPGMATPGHAGPKTTACKLKSAGVVSSVRAARATGTTGTTAQTPVAAPGSSEASGSAGPQAGTGGGGGAPSVSQTLHNLSSTVSQVLSLLTGGSSSGAGSALGLGSGAHASGSASGGTGSGGSGSGGTQRLLSYLLSP